MVAVSFGAYGTSLPIGDDCRRRVLGQLPHIAALRFGY
jgi:hypothetical protein